MSRKKRHKYHVDLAVLNEEPKLLRALCPFLPNRPDYKTVREWCTVGKLNEENRTRVRLGSAASTAGRISSVAAYWRFIRALNGSAPMGVD